MGAENPKVVFWGYTLLGFRFDRKAYESYQRFFEAFNPECSLEYVATYFARNIAKREPIAVLISSEHSSRQERMARALAKRGVDNVYLDREEDMPITSGRLQELQDSSRNIRDIVFSPSKRKETQRYNLRVLTEMLSPSGN